MKTYIKQIYKPKIVLITKSNQIFFKYIININYFLKENLKHIEYHSFFTLKETYMSESHFYSNKIIISFLKN